MSKLHKIVSSCGDYLLITKVFRPKTLVSFKPSFVLVFLSNNTAECLLKVHTVHQITKRNVFEYYTEEQKSYLSELDSIIAKSFINYLNAFVDHDRSPNLEALPFRLEGSIFEKLLKIEEGIDLFMDSIESSLDKSINDEHDTLSFLKATLMGFKSAIQLKIKQVERYMSTVRDETQREKYVKEFQEYLEKLRDTLDSLINSVESKATETSNYVLKLLRSLDKQNHERLAETLQKIQKLINFKIESTMSDEEGIEEKEEIERLKYFFEHLSSGLMVNFTESIDQINYNEGIDTLKRKASKAWSFAKNSPQIIFDFFKTHVKPSSDNIKINGQEIINIEEEFINLYDENYENEIENEMLNFFKDNVHIVDIKIRTEYSNLYRELQKKIDGFIEMDEEVRSLFKNLDTLNSKILDKELETFDDILRLLDEVVEKTQILESEIEIIFDFLRLEMVRQLNLNRSKLLLKLSMITSVDSLKKQRTYLDELDDLSSKLVRLLKPKSTKFIEQLNEQRKMFLDSVKNDKENLLIAIKHLKHLEKSQLSKEKRTQYFDKYEKQIDFVISSLTSKILDSLNTLETRRRRVFSRFQQESVLKEAMDKFMEEPQYSKRKDLRSMKNSVESLISEVNDLILEFAQKLKDFEEFEITKDKIKKGKSRAQKSDEEIEHQLKFDEL
eukprot:TRINITY_DN9272_c0_g1_i1.p1 TRINITY_DN9272_c0_g1~~TRINITY_DN9272_c0_g1_i1.p1  ORF type:complete len:732 (+),score=259.60 TRINITY_DN9272_c0_g1_i1:186-2198(+)